MKRLKIEDILKDNYKLNIGKVDFNDQYVKNILNQAKEDQKRILSLKKVPFEEYMKVVNI